MLYINISGKPNQIVLPNYLLMHIMTKHACRFDSQ